MTGKYLTRVLAVAVLVWIALLDPFQLNSRLDTASQAAADRLMAPWYEPASARPVADLMVLVTINTETVRKDHAFPVSYSELASVIQAAEDNGARAVFLDFTFFNRGLDQPGKATADLTQLISVMRDAQRAGLDIFTGPIDADPALEGLRQAVTDQAAISWTADHPLDYAFVGQDLLGVKRLTPAVHLYRTYCKSEPERSRCDSALINAFKNGVRGSSGLPPLAIQFGMGPAPGQDRFTDPAALQACETGSPRNPFSAAGRGLVEGALGATAPPCPNHLEIPIQSLPGGADLLKNRIVVVGVTPDLGDSYLAPGIGKIAGAEVHLMALDNLITYGGAYPRWPPNWLWSFNLTGLLKILVVGAMPWALDLAIKLAKVDGHAKRRRLIGILAFILIILIGLAALLALVVHAPVGGVLGFAMLGLGVSAVLDEQEFAEAFRLRPRLSTLGWLVLGALSLLLALAGLGTGQPVLGVAAAVSALAAAGLIFASRMTSATKSKASAPAAPPVSHLGTET